MALGPEDILHKSVVRFLQVAAPSLQWWHTPNGGQRSAKTAALLKSMGTRAGVADLAFVLPPAGRIHFIELKAPKGSQQQSQKEFQADMEAVGAPYAICRSIDEVAQTLRGWGVPLRARGE